MSAHVVLVAIGGPRRASSRLRVHAWESRFAAEGVETRIFALHPDLPDEQTGNRGHAPIIWKVSSGGGTPEQVMRFPARVFGLCWHADGRSFYAVTNLGVSHYDIWRVPFEEPLSGMSKFTESVP